MNVIPAIKFVGAWVCIIVACLALAHVVAAPAEVFAVLALAFAMAPSAWA